MGNLLVQVQPRQHDKFMGLDMKSNIQLDIEVAEALGWTYTQDEPRSKYFTLHGPKGQNIGIKSPAREPLRDAIEYDDIIPRYSRDLTEMWKLFNEYIYPNNPSVLQPLGDLTTKWLKKDPYEVCEELCYIFIEAMGKQKADH